MSGKIIQSDAFVLVGLLALGIVHGLALVYRWYFTYPALSPVLHLSGGFLAACLFLWFVSRYHEDILPRNSVLFLLVLLGAVALGGVLWEFFEFILDRLNTSPLFRAQLGVSDTMADLALDLSGGLVAFLIARFSR